MANVQWSSRTAAAILVSCLLVLAGCQVPFSGDGTEERPGRLEVPERYPPGVSESGVDDPQRLVFNHSDRLYRTSYTVEERTVIRDADGRIRTETEKTTWRASNGTYRAIQTARAGPGLPGDVDVNRFESWGNGSVGLIAIESRNQTQYAEASRRTYDRTYSDRLVYLLSTLETDYAGTETIDRGEVYVVTANASTAPDRVGIFGFRDVRNVTFTAWVDVSGLIRAWRLEYEGDRDGERVRVERSVEFDGVGATAVERPGWVDTALNRTDTLDRE